MMRVLQVIGVMNRGGAETMIMNLYRKVDRTKIQFDFVQNENPGAAYDDEILALGGKIYHCPRYRGENHFSYIKWWRTFFEEHEQEYPIVHGHIGSTAAIYLSIAKKYGAYTIAHSHNTSANMLYRFFSYPTRYVADAFFACSRDAGVSRYGKRIGTNPARCTVLHNAIDTSRFAFQEESRNYMRSILGIRESQFVVGNISRFSEQKNHRFLIEIFEKLHEIDVNTLLLLVGDGELRSQLEASIKEKNLEKAVIMTGIQSNTWDYYQAMDVFLMPSLYEGLPVSMVEAQCSGLPCCVSTGVPREAAITDLVQFRSLEDSSECWVEWIQSYAGRQRRSMTEELRQAGYDIAKTSEFLQNYYLEAAEKHGH